MSQVATKAQTEAAESQKDACRLCGGEASFAFSRLVLCAHQVSYFRCNACGSLQTEQPYWLDKAYSFYVDAGAMQRNLHNMAVCYALSKIFGFKNVIDFGGGDGVLCRLLRDYGLNCFVSDKYRAPTYALGFSEPDFAQADLLSAFEVMEHLSDPARELEEIFAHGAKAMLLSTCLYENEGADWWYLAPDGGQHIFFYSRKAVQDLAARRGFEAIIVRDMILLVRPDAMSFARRQLAKLALNPYAGRVMRGLMVTLMRPRGMDRDTQTIGEMLRKRLGAASLAIAVFYEDASAWLGVSAMLAG